MRARVSNSPQIWENLPPVVRRLVPKPWVVLVLWFLVPIGLLIVMGTNAVMPEHLWIPVLMWSVVLLTPRVLGWWYLRRYQRLFRAAGGRLCVSCGQDLRGLGESGICPECGQAFDVQLDRRRWKAAGIDE